MILPENAATGGLLVPNRDQINVDSNNSLTAQVAQFVVGSGTDPTHTDHRYGGAVDVNYRLKQSRSQRRRPSE